MVGVPHLWQCLQAMYQRHPTSKALIGSLWVPSNWVTHGPNHSRVAVLSRQLRSGARKMTIVGSTNDPLRISWNSNHDCEPMIKVCGNTPKGKNQEIMLLGNGIRNLVVGTWHCLLSVSKMPDQIAASRSDRIWPIVLLLVASSIWPHHTSPTTHFRQTCPRTHLLSRRLFSSLDVQGCCNVFYSFC